MNKTCKKDGQMGTAQTIWMPLFFGMNKPYLKSMIGCDIK